MKSHEKPRIDSRVAIAWGDVDRETLNPERVSESAGRAFTESGRSLRRMKKPTRMAIVAADAGDSDRERLLVASARLMDEVVTRWKPAQARAVALALLGMNQEKIARELEISQSTVNQSIRSAGWPSLEVFLREMEHR